MSTLLIDISSYQGKPDFNAVRGAGISGVLIKATQGSDYLNPYFQVDRDNARAAGLLVGFYHFANATDAINEANYFVNAVGALQQGDIVALDWEVQANDPVSWCLAFLKQVEARTGVKPLIYINKSTEAGFDWSPVVRNDNGLWIANYDYDANNAAPQVNHWPVVAIEQYSDRGAVAGVAGGVDCDVFFGDLDTLKKYGYQGGAPAPIPVPVPAPPPAPAPTPPPTPAQGRVQIAAYIVKAGDNLTDIAKKFPEADVTAQSIAADNGIANPNAISVGQVLRILSAQGGNVSLPTMAWGEQSENVRKLQQFLNYYNWRPALPLLPTTGYYGDMTAAILHRAGQQIGVQGDSDGRHFGPHFQAAFAAIGFRI